jgi:hypothetical protein
MRLKNYIFIGCISILIIGIRCISAKSISANEKIILWNLNSLKTIGGNSLDIIGSPKVSDDNAIEFDGIDDGILVHNNPIKDAKAFSIEVVFKPYDAYPKNIEQRFLHIQDPNNKNRRLLIELRLNSKKQWYPDLYMKSDDKSLTLVDSTKTHPVNEWATIKLDYRNNQMKGYVNDVEELSGEIEYFPVGDSAKVSLGTRMDKRSWFNGSIKSVKFNREY